MKKLVLRLDDLTVETFTTAGTSTGKGTVAGHYGTTHTQTQEQTLCKPSCAITECPTYPAPDTCCFQTC